MNDLNKFASPIMAENNFIKASFGGFAGSGKTRTATELIIGCYKKMGCNKPILIIDNEKGSRFLIPIFKNAGIEAFIKETVHLPDILEAFRLLNSGQISFLFIDSLTKVWYKYVRNYREKNKRTFMTLQDWGKILPSWQEDFADEFVNLTGNCIFTGRGGYTYDMEEDENKKKQFVKSGVKMKMAGETPFEPDINIWMEISQEIGKTGHPVIWREGLVMKDRSGIIDGKTFKNPTFKDFEPVVDFLLTVKKGKVAKETDTTNISPHESYDGRRKEKEILLEKIKSEFDKRQFSTGKEDKQMKIMIIEKIFKSTAIAEIETYSIEKLTRCLGNLSKLMSDFDQSENRIELIKTFELK